MVKRIAYVAIPILILASIGVLPVSLVMGGAGGSTTAAVTVTATPAFVSEPGGGGGGVRPSPTPLVTAAGMFTQRVFLYSEDGVVELLLREGTIGLTEVGEPLSEVAAGEMDETYMEEMGEVYIVKVEAPPPPPLGAEFIGPVYDVGPTGTIFRPQISLSFTYNEDLLPEGVAEENLILARWDEADEQWKPLEVFIVAPEINIITTRIDHLSLFAILAYARPADFATFAASSLLVVPTEVDTGEKVIIVIAVANTGGQSGSYEVVLKINGLLEASQEVTIAPGDSELVSFDIVKNTAGTYSLEAAGFTGSFTVREKPASPTVTPPSTVTPLPSIVTAPSPINWPVIGGIIAAVVLAIAAMIYSFLIGRRYRYAAVTYPAEVERPIAPPTVASPAPEPISYPAVIRIGEVIGRIMAAVAGRARFLVSKVAVAIVRWTRLLSQRK